MHLPKSSMMHWSSTTGSKNAGNITIYTNTFHIADGAALSARTQGSGQGGNITVNAMRSFEAINGGQLVTTTSANGNAGNIFVNSKDQVTISGSDPSYFKRSNLIDQTQHNLSPNQFALIANDIKEGSASALLTNAETNSNGLAGNIRITTKQLTVQKGGQVAVGSSGLNDAGNLEVIANRILLDNQPVTTGSPIVIGTLTANHSSGSGGNIILTVKDLLLMRNNSLISTNLSLD